MAKRYDINWDRWRKTIVYTYQAGEAKRFKARFHSGDIDGAIESAVRYSLKYATPYIVSATYYGWNVAYLGQYAEPTQATFFYVDGLTVYRCKRIYGV